MYKRSTRVLYPESLEDRRLLAADLGVDLSPAYNAAMPTDVNGDSIRSPMDVLLIVNSINANETVQSVLHHCDTNNDGVISALDALLVVNAINTTNSNTPDAAGERDSAPSPADGEGSFQGGTGGEQSDELMDAAQDHIHKAWESSFEEEFFAGVAGIPLAPIGIVDIAADALFESFDENSDGSLTENEVPSFAWNHLIDRGVDADGNQAISSDEIDGGLESYRMRRFNDVDTNGDGNLNADEVPRPIWNRLSAADTNDDGGVSFEEFEEYGSLSPFERLDANGDEALTEDEVSERLWNRIERFDADEDGRVTESELPNRRQDVTDRISRIADMAARIFRRIRG
ncbi:MAG: dockerin type I domain-containing protein [Aureliella sp.]